VTPRRVAILAALLAVGLSVAGGAPASVSVGRLARIDHVADGDTVDLTNGAKVRLVQIDTPEVYFSPECYGKKASAITKRLLPPGTLVRLTREPATDSVDSYGRLLRYVTRVRGQINVNVRLVAVWASSTVLLPRAPGPLRGPPQASAFVPDAYGLAFAVPRALRTRRRTPTPAPIPRSQKK
jgi:Staphylococcal nuclease homologue